MKNFQKFFFRGVFIEDKNAPLFSFSNTIYGDQLKKNFPINVYKNGAWGTYAALSLPIDNISTNEAHVGLEFNDETVDLGLVQTNPNIYK